MMYQRRDWIIQRCTLAYAGNDVWEDFTGVTDTNLKTREAMESTVERLALSNPGEVFRGHNVAYCPDSCHARAFKRGEL